MPVRIILQVHELKKKNTETLSVNNITHARAINSKFSFKNCFTTIGLKITLTIEHSKEVWTNGG